MKVGGVRLIHDGLCSKVFPVLLVSCGNTCITMSIVNAAGHNVASVPNLFGALVSLNVGYMVVLGGKPIHRIRVIPS